jgi:hypothetical protein
VKGSRHDGDLGFTALEAGEPEKKKKKEKSTDMLYAAKAQRR